jgi:imidazole glycerol-phosphate synthase subunit HisH
VNVAVVDHGMGNLRSVVKALEAAGADVSVTDDTQEIERAEALCVPGQGIFGRCMEVLYQSGLDTVIRRWIAAGRPYLGICLGMQVLFESSEEGGGKQGLGIFPGRVRRLPSGATVPHMGWNEVCAEWFYFDHSYAVHPLDASIVRGWCHHGERFAAWVQQHSITAVQFHPEKSSRAGIRLLEQWLTT